jgi:hypothetical protein
LSVKHPGVGRGHYPRSRPAKVYVNLRLPPEMAEFYKAFPNASAKMRQALAAYMEQEQARGADA